MPLEAGRWREQDLSVLKNSVSGFSRAVLFSWFPGRRKNSRAGDNNCSKQGYIYDKKIINGCIGRPRNKF